VRLVLLFSLVALLPGMLLYAVSVQFVGRSIESWFDVRVDHALDSSLNLGRTALDYVLRDATNKAGQLAISLSDANASNFAQVLNRASEQIGDAVARVRGDGGERVGVDGDRIERLYGRIVQRLDAMPGVESATVTDIVPLSGLQDNYGFFVPGSAPKNVHFVRIGPAYFQTFATPLIAGRVVGVQDDSRAPHVAVVNAMAAEALFGDETVLGRRLTMQSDPPVEFEVVGVVQNSRYTSPRDPDPATVYLPYAQTTLGRLGPMSVAVRSSVPADALEGLVKAAMAEVDPDVPVTDLRSEVSQIDETLTTERTFLRLLLVFGAFALLLAGIGLHGITAYAVVRRTKEIGVRVALGAQRTDVLWLILRQVAAVTLLGIAVGIPAALGATQLVRASLYGVEPTDPLSLVGAMVVMLVVAASAGLVPARRAAGLDPLATLRYD